MKIRKVASLTAALSFLMMVLTSVVLYIVPQGRIAYWSDWRLGGLSKEQWGGIHINLGFLFLMALGVHIYFNWTPMMNYLKDKTKQMKVFTKEFNISLLITLLFALGTLFEIPPFSTILDISDGIKDRHAQTYGEPPYGHAELSSLKTFTKKTGIDLQQALSQLKERGYTASSENETLLEISKLNKVSPQQIYLAIKSDSQPSVVKVGKAMKLPDSPPAGTGNMTLADLCSQYNLNMKEIVRALEKEGVDSDERLIIKKIAEKNNMGPMDLYEKIKSASLD